MRKKSELIFSLLQVPIDFLAITAAFVLAYIIRVKIDARPVANPIGAILFLKIILLAAPIWLIIFVVSGLYNLSSQRGRFAELGKVLVAVMSGTMVMILFDFLTHKPLFPSRSIPIYAFVLSFIFVSLGRQIMRAIQRYLFSYNIGIRRTLLVGSGPIAEQIFSGLNDTDLTGYRFVGLFDTAKPKGQAFEDLRIYKTLDEALSPRLDEIIQADSDLEPEEVIKLVEYATNHHLAYRFVPNQFGVFASNSTLAIINGQPTIEIRHTPLDGWGRIVKRAFDVVGATLALIIFSPLMLIIALIAKLTDPGPALYRQKRLTRENHKISILKFRTMLRKFSVGDGVKSEEEAFEKMGRPELIAEFRKENKLTNDPRVSWFGRFLRRTSLDELPQLINVLRGDLSLVGPRPMFENEIDRFGEELPKILALRCGVTGLWQVSGRSDVGFEGRVKLDIYYVENWSLWLDIKILLKTIFTLFKKNGAY